jgi:hypothetical protein
MSKKPIVQFVTPNELPDSDFGKPSPTKETQEWQAIIKALPDCNRKRILKVLLSKETLELSGGKRGDAFNFQQLLRRYLREQNIKAKVITRKEAEGYALYVQAG